MPYNPWAAPGSSGFGGQGPAAPGAAAPQGFGPPVPSAPAPGSAGAFYPGAVGSGRRNGSYNAQSAGSNGAAPGWAMDTFRNRYTDAMNRSGGLAETAEDEYLKRAQGFDAQGYVDQAARGAFNQFMPELSRSIEGLRGEQVGMGRLNTGFATEDEDRLITRGLSDFTDHLSGLALQGGRMQMENDQGIGRFGAEMGGRYLDLIGGGMDRKTAEQNAKKGGGIGGFLQGAAQIGGMFL